MRELNAAVAACRRELERGGLRCAEGDGDVVRQPPAELLARHGQMVPRGGAEHARHLRGAQQSRVEMLMQALGRHGATSVRAGPPGGTRRTVG